MRAKLYATLGAIAFAAVALLDTGLRTSHADGVRYLTSGPLGGLTLSHELPYNGTANLLNMVWAGSSIVTALSLWKPRQRAGHADAQQ